MGPLGLLSPHPGVSYLFSGSEATPQSLNDTNETGGSLWGIANANGAGNGGPGGAFMYGGGLSSPPVTWTPALGEMVLKIDGKFKVSVAASEKNSQKFTFRF